MRCLIRASNAEFLHEVSAIDFATENICLDFYDFKKFVILNVSKKIF